MELGKPPRIRALLLGDSAALNLKVLYCLYPFAETYFLARTEDNYAARSRHVKQSFVLDFTETGKVDALKEIIREHGIDVLVPGDMTASAALADLDLPLGDVAILPVSPDPVLERIHDKWTFAETLRKADLPTPKTVLLDDVKKLTPAMAEPVSFPMIVKPLQCESSHGVVRMDSYEELHAYVNEDRPYNDPPLIFQQFIPGEDIDISVIADKGEVLVSAVQQWTPDDTLFFCNDPEMEEVTGKIIKLFDFSGPAHFDMRRHAETGKLYVFECNPRFWYTLPAARWAGLNFVEAAVYAALGRDYGHLGPARGHYRLPGDVVRAWRKPARWFSMSARNWAGFLEPLLDPVPHISQKRQSTG